MTKKYSLITILLIMTLILAIAIDVSYIKAYNTDKVVNTKTYCIDSIEYHCLQCDNIAQVNPYWRLHLRGTNIWIHTETSSDVGDSITLTINR